ncbi:MAG: hypothetical protein M1816_005283 [Peltula sp. TS41687]|nr:MAG: hypothetical protein M1816_005283 [Peltula sp. TS41687]
MWKSTLGLVFLPATFLALGSTTSLSPFIAPTPEEAWNVQRQPVGLQKRQNSCPSNYNPCSSLNAGFSSGSVCCASGTDCQLDQAGHVACCPRGASCTGTISVGTASSSTGAGGGNTAGGFIVGGAGGGPTTSGSGLAAASSTTTNNFLAPATTTSITQQGFTPGAPSNAYFGFIPIATPFPNQQVCSSAYSSCQTEFQKCTATLGGGGVGANGVSISVGGVTINGPVTLLAPSAASICQSLSTQACLGLQLSNCNGLARGSGNAAAMPTPWPPVYGVGVGVGLIVGGVAEHILGGL